MKKEEKLTSKDQKDKHESERFMEDQIKKNNIKDYDRAWEDDRL